MAQPPPPSLTDVLIEECLLCLPPDDPANLVRAALVCKCWCRIIADRGFRRRFCQLHGRPPMLGFFHVHTRYGSLFTPTSLFCPRDINAYLRHGSGWHAIDARHGRVLLSRSPSLGGSLDERRRSDLAVWDPISGDRLDLPRLPPPLHHGWFSFKSKAAVLCACISGCDHLDCHRGNFLVVLMDATYRWVDAVVRVVVDVYVYSSHGDAWNHVTSATKQERSIRFVPRQNITMAENALYFKVYKNGNNGILKYDMGAHEVSWLDLPPDCSRQNCRILLTAMEHGGLRIVRVEKNTMLIHLWSMEAGPNGVLGWAPSGVIELKTLLPANSGTISTDSVVHNLGALFIMTNAGGFTVDLVSNRVMKVCGNICVNYFVPYTSFCTPALSGAFTGEGSSSEVSN